MIPQNPRSFPPPPPTPGHPEFPGRREDSLSRAEAEALVAGVAERLVAEKLAQSSLSALVEQLVAARIAALVASGDLKGDPGQDADPAEPGRDGAAATIQIGTVTTLPAGSRATVSNSGTTNAAVLNFGIPRGFPGFDGTQALSEAQIRAIVTDAINKYYDRSASGASIDTTSLEALVRRAENARVNAESAASSATQTASTLSNRLSDLAELKAAVTALRANSAYYLNQIRSPTGLVRLKVRDPDASASESGASAVLECVTLFAPQFLPGGVSLSIRQNERSSISVSGPLQFTAGTTRNYQSGFVAAGGEWAIEKNSSVDSYWHLRHYSNGAMTDFDVSIADFDSASPLLLFDKAVGKANYGQGQVQYSTNGTDWSDFTNAGAESLGITLSRSYAVSEFPLEATGASGYVTSPIPDYLTSSFVYKGATSALSAPSITAPRIGDLWKLTGSVTTAYQGMSVTYPSGTYVFYTDYGWAALTQPQSIPTARNIPIENPSGQQGGWFGSNDNVAQWIETILSFVGYYSGAYSSLDSRISDLSYRVNSLEGSH